MPTYEYACDACEHAFEEFQSITAKPLRKCPECGKQKLRRLIGTGAGIIFKGSGFYETDYRSDGYKKAEKAESSNGKDSGNGNAKKSGESKSGNKESGKATKTDAAKPAPKPKPKTDK